MKHPLRRDISPLVRKPLQLLLVSVLLVCMCGCGGGGGGGESGDADPLAPEINAQVDGFVAAVNAEQVVGGTAASAMYYIDSNIYYYRSGVNAFLRSPAFQEHLQAFLDSSENVSLSIDGRECTSNGENWALCAGTLNCTWTDSQGTARSLSEPVQIEWQQVPRWGITKLSRHAETGLQFPPAP